VCVRLHENNRKARPYLERFAGSRSLLPPTFFFLPFGGYIKPLHCVAALSVAKQLIPHRDFWSVGVLLEGAFVGCGRCGGSPLAEKRVKAYLRVGECFAGREGGGPSSFGEFGSQLPRMRVAMGTGRPRRVLCLRERSLLG
jgi:hypothetical protein